MIERVTYGFAVLVVVKTSLICYFLSKTAVTNYILLLYSINLYIQETAEDGNVGLIQFYLEIDNTKVTVKVTIEFNNNLLQVTFKPSFKCVSLFITEILHVKKH